MAANNTPAVSPRLARMGSEGAHSGLEGGHAKNEAGGRMPSPGGGRGGGGNPISAGMDEEGHQLLPLGRPGTLSGIIGRMLDKSDVATNNETIDAAKDSKTQIAADLATKLSKSINDAGGDTQRGLLNLMADPDNAREVMGNPKAFEQVMGYHQMLQQTAPDTVNDIGRGMLSVNIQGQHHVVPAPKQAGEPVNIGGKFFNINGTTATPIVVGGAGVQGPGTTYPGSAGSTTGTGAPAASTEPPPATARGVATPTGGMNAPGDQLSAPAAAVQGRPPTDAELKTIGSLQNQFTALDGLKNAVGASGSWGYGGLQAWMAHSPFGSEQNTAFDAYSKQLKAAAIEGFGGSKLKAPMEALLDTMPKQGNATYQNVSQFIPSLEYKLREAVANLQGAGVSSPVLAQLADTHGAGFALMGQLSDARHQLAVAPNQLTPHQVGNVLLPEVVAGRLPVDLAAPVIKQAAMLGIISTDKMGYFDKEYPALHLGEPPKPNEMRQPLQPGMPPTGMELNYRAHDGQTVSPVLQPPATGLGTGGQPPTTPSMPAGTQPGPSAAPPPAPVAPPQAVGTVAPATSADMLNAQELARLGAAPQPTQAAPGQPTPASSVPPPQQPAAGAPAGSPEPPAAGLAPGASFGPGNPVPSKPAPLAAPVPTPTQPAPAVQPDQHASIGRPAAEVDPRTGQPLAAPSPQQPVPSIFEKLGAAATQIGKSLGVDTTGSSADWKAEHPNSVPAAPAAPVKPWYEGMNPISSALAAEGPQMQQDVGPGQPQPPIAAPEVKAQNSDPGAAAGATPLSPAVQETLRQVNAAASQQNVEPSDHSNEQILARIANDPGLAATIGRLYNPEPGRATADIPEASAGAPIPSQAQIPPKQPDDQ